MLKNILVYLDGSAADEAALTLALRWADEFAAGLVGLGVIDEPGIRSAEPVPLGAAAFKTARDDKLVAKARRETAEAVARFRSRCGAAGLTGRPVERVGDPVEELAREGEECDLLVVGREAVFAAADGPESAFRRVLNATPRPVVVAVPNAPPAGPALIAYDGSVQAARTVEAFVGTGIDTRREVRVVCVHPDADRAAELLARAGRYLAAHGVAMTAVPVVTSDDPGRVLVEEAARAGAELLVAGAYGKSAFREFFLGSVTRTLLRDSRVPMFLSH